MMELNNTVKKKKVPGLISITTEETKFKKKNYELKKKNC